jgi:nuclear transport factor 2 (NTF2) superfamily protein
LLADIEPIEAFLTRKWKRELDYRLIKKLWYPRQPLAKSRRVPAGARGHQGVPDHKWNRELDYRLKGNAA